MTGGAGVDGIEAVERPGHRIALVKLERVPGLRVDVHADDIEPGAVVAHSRAASAAEEIEDSHVGQSTCG
jgi:hypothetical protein